MVKQIKRFTQILIATALLAGCGSSRSVRTHVRTETLQASRIELKDSTSHRYRVEVIRVYSPAGVVEREETRQEGEVQTLVQLVRDTLYIQQRDTLYIERERKIAGAGKSFFVQVAFFAAGLTVIYLILRFLKKKL